MTEDLYGDVDAATPEAPAPKRKRKSKALQEAPKKKKPEVQGFHLRIGVMGTLIDIMSPIPRDQFCEEMCDTINERSSDPGWSGIYHLKKIDGKIVSVRLRSIDVVEEM
jgi:hypothetical protein